MALTKLFTDFAVTLHRLTAEAAGPEFLDGVQSVELSSNLETLLERSDGAYRNTFGALRSGAPRVVSRTSDLKTLLDKVTDFSLIDSDGSHPGIEFHYQRFAQGGAREATNAVKVTVGSGMLVVRTLELSHQATASLGFEVIPTSTDGAADPVTFDEAAALPAAAPETDAVWTLGKVDLGALDLEGVRSLSLDFGVGELVESRDSDIYSTFASVQVQQPRITVRASHIDATSGITEGGVFVTSGVVFWARKRAEGGTFVADGTPEHISFTLGKTRVEWQTIGSDPKEIQVTLTPWNTEAGAAPLVVSTTAIIV